jgi:Ca2+-binding EF-hand superfamily protein
MLHEYDHNHDGTISYDEFKRYTTQRETDMAAAFRAFDEDGNGEISADELGKVCVPVPHNSVYILCAPCQCCTQYFVNTGIAGSWASICCNKVRAGA